MKIVTLHIPGPYLKGLDELVNQRLYLNRAEAIRIAIQDLLDEELWIRKG